MVFGGGKACDTQENDTLAVTTTCGIETGSITNCGGAETTSTNYITTIVCEYEQKVKYICTVSPNSTSPPLRTSSLLEIKHYLKGAAAAYE